MLLIRSIANCCSALVNFCHTAVTGSGDSAEMNFCLIFLPPWKWSAHIIQPEAGEDEAESISNQENQPVYVSRSNLAPGTTHWLFDMLRFLLRKHLSMRAESKQVFRQKEVFQRTARCFYELPFAHGQKAHEAGEQDG